MSCRSNGDADESLCPASLIIVLCTATSYGQCPAAHNPRTAATTTDHVAHLNSWLFRNRRSQSVVHACPCSHALRAHARCTVTQVNMRDVPLHADRVREGNAARSSCTYTMRSFRGVHGNLCVPANICRTGCSKARHGPSMPVRGPTRVQHQMWQNWNNETWFILFWVVKGRGGPCDRSRRHACPCIGPASSLSIAIFTRAISLAFSNRIATVINQPWRGLHLA